MTAASTSISQRDADLKLMQDAFVEAIPLQGTDRTIRLAALASGLLKATVQNFSNVRRLADFVDIFAKYDVWADGVLSIKRTKEQCPLTLHKLMRVFLGIFRTENDAKDKDALKQWVKLHVDELEFLVEAKDALKIVLSKPGNRKESCHYRLVTRVLNVSSACFETLKLVDFDHHWADMSAVRMEREIGFNRLMVAHKVPNFHNEYSAIFDMRRQKLFGYLEKEYDGDLFDFLRQFKPNVLERLHLCHQVVEALTWHDLQVYLGDLLPSAIQYRKRDQEAKENAAAFELSFPHPEGAVAFGAAQTKVPLPRNQRISTPMCISEEDARQREKLEHDEKALAVLEDKIAVFQLGTTLYSLLVSYTKSNYEKMLPYELDRIDEWTLGHPISYHKMNRGPLEQQRYPTNLIDLLERMLDFDTAKRPSWSIFKAEWAKIFPECELAMQQFVLPKQPSPPKVPQVEPWMSTALKLRPFLSSDYVNFFRSLSQIETDEKSRSEIDVKEFAGMFTLYHEEKGKAVPKNRGLEIDLRMENLFQVVHRIVSLVTLDDYKSRGLYVDLGEDVFLAKLEAGRHHVFLLSEDKIGEGSTSITFRVLSVFNATMVVLKCAFATPTRRAIVAHEIRMLQHMHQHKKLDRVQPPIIASFDNRLFGYVSDLFDEDLSAYVNRFKRTSVLDFDIEARKATCKEFVKAIQELWSIGVRHGDIHNGNFLRNYNDPERKLYVADFGFANTDDIPAPVEVQRNPFINSPYDQEYLEKAKASKSKEEIRIAEEKRDVFMLGSLLFSTLTHEPAPYPIADEQITELEWIRRIQKDTPFFRKALEELKYPKALIDLIESMVKQKPNERITPAEFNKIWAQIFPQ